MRHWGPPIKGPRATCVPPAFLQRSPTTTTMSTSKPARRFSPWLLLGLTSLLLSVLLDVVSMTTEGWASSGPLLLGVWRLCGPLQQLGGGGGGGVGMGMGPTTSSQDYGCLPPLTAGLDWYQTGVVLEAIGLIASIGILIAGLATVFTVRHQGHWWHGRGPVAALIPLAAISGFFNFAGSVTIARGLPDLLAHVGFSLALDVCAAVLAGIGMTFCVLDLQGVGWGRKHHKMRTTGFPV